MDGNGTTQLLLLEERIVALERRIGDYASLRQDLERTYRVIIEVQIELRNHHKEFSDKLDGLKRARGEAGG